MAVYTTIDDSEAYFQTVLYTGDGSADNAITLPGDTDMQPDFVWIKNRDATDNHCLFDAVRGATKVLHCNVTDAESTDADTLDSFTSDGFQVDADVKVNTNTEKYAAWNWKAGTTSGIVTNASTDITPSAYSFNQTAGFNVFKFTGAGNSGDTVAHGLGAIPEFIIIKVTGTTHGWITYHGALGGTKNLNLETSNAPATAISRWNNTNPDSVNITLGNSNNVNGASTDYICYAFSGKQGYSKFGEYTGNGNAAGPFVYTGFRPAWVMIKQYNDAGSWNIFDNKRQGYNVENDLFLADGTNVEADVTVIDLLSNGFKMRDTDDDRNGSGDTYVYVAFAEAPFVNSNGVPNNAR